MTDSNSLLIEIGTEELPPKALRSLSKAFAEGIADGLRQNNLTIGDSQVFATPRRMGVIIEKVPSQQEDQVVQRLGPAVAAAFKDGEPTQAAIGFAKSCGVEVQDLEQLETDKGVRLGINVEQKGVTVDALIPDIVEKTLSSLPVPKRMRWGDSDTEFVRPVHWLVMLYGSDVVAGRILGLEAGRLSRGHRFHHNNDLPIEAPETYVDTLRMRSLPVPVRRGPQRWLKMIY